MNQTLPLSLLNHCCGLLHLPDMHPIVFFAQVVLVMASFPSPIPLPSLPSLLAPDADLSASDLIAESQIRNTLATYPFAIDSKNFSALSFVFHPDAVANYSEPLNVITGLPEIESTLEASLAMFAGTQHSYSTQAIRLDEAQESARAVTYFTAAHFGKGQAEGQVYGFSLIPLIIPILFWFPRLQWANFVFSLQVLYAYGQYQDLLTPSEQGQWLIKERNLVYMVSSTAQAQMMVEYANFRCQGPLIGNLSAFTS